MRSSATLLFAVTYLGLTTGLQSIAPRMLVPTAPCSGIGHCKSRTSSTQLNVIGIETVGVALISAAAGAAARQPEIETLQADLAQARQALETSKDEMVHKIEVLEDKLFEMDKAYEAQTAKFQREYEKKKEEELAKITEKMKTDYKYKLEIEVEREKSRLLSETLGEVKNLDQSAKLVQMRLRQKELEDAKKTLEIAVAKAEEEIEILRNAPKKSGFWPF